MESWHWNDILSTLKEMYPEITLDRPFKYEGSDIIVPTKFNPERMESLGVEVIGIKEILAESVNYLRDSGLLK